METAINIFWDSQSKINNRILIIGLGSVGLLTAIFLKLTNIRIFMFMIIIKIREKLPNI